MSWPWAFINLSHEEIVARRGALDLWSLVAHASSFLPLLGLLVRTTAFWVRARLDSSSTTYASAAAAAAAHTTTYHPLPHSPALKSLRQSRAGRLAAVWRRARWWAGEEVVVPGTGALRTRALGTRLSTAAWLSWLVAPWGRRGDWVLGAGYALWLGFLCVVDTRGDYLHLTKRIGIVALSQFPAHYLLSLKFISPFALVLDASHESLNRYHRVLGRLILALVALHVSLYLNFFLRFGLLLQRLASRVVQAGLASALLAAALALTALRPVRALSYRVFFLTHLLVALAVPVLLVFHVHHALAARWWIGEALASLVLDNLLRRLVMTTTVAAATVEPLPDTRLLKVTLPLSARRLASLRSRPASHFLLSVSVFPSRPAAVGVVLPVVDWPAAILGLVSGPFTVAAVDEAAGQATLVVRRRSGPVTKRLASIADASAVEPVTVMLGLDGPYGEMGRRFGELTGRGWDRVLLVAGGVGATFAVPLYTAIRTESPSTKADLVWAVRSAADATWAVTAGGRDLIKDENVHMYVTGPVVDVAVSELPPPLDLPHPSLSSSKSVESLESPESPDSPASLDSPDSPRSPDPLSSPSAIELRPLRHQDGEAVGGNGRPDLRKIVDDAFRQGFEERVAVLVCGPAEMVRELRAAVGVWVAKGRVVWWHDEGFGW